MSLIKRLAEGMAEERGMTFQQYMNQPEENWDDEEDGDDYDYEPDLNGTDISEFREQMDSYRSLR